MTRNKKIKKYLEAHPGATVEDYNNQLHKMHVQQSKNFTHSKHAGSKKQKTIMSNVHNINKSVKSFIEKLMYHQD